jgi:hypothetical protein
VDEKLFDRPTGFADRFPRFKYYDPLRIRCNLLHSQCPEYFESVSELGMRRTYTLKGMALAKTMPSETAGSA